MGENTRKSRFPYHITSVFLLMIQYAVSVVLLHYSRVMPAVGGKRYVTSTAVFLTEAIKLAISLTVALYEVSKKVPPSMPATSLFFSLTNAVFSGDSWKLALPAVLFTLANSLQYLALSNAVPATFQITYQIKLLFAAVSGFLILRRSIPMRNWGLLLFLAIGVALLQLPGQESDQLVARDDHLHFPRYLEEWKQRTAAGAGKFQKRSASYEGIEEDMLLEHPPLNSSIGLFATLGASVASALATTYLERVIRDSSTQRSLWMRNVQLALYSVFPALFIGVIFLDGETIANQGFFGGYNWVVWTLIAVQTIGGIGAAFTIAHTDKTAKTMATGLSIILSTIVSLSVFDLELSANFFMGAAVVLVATFLYSSQPSSIPIKMRPPPIRIETYEKGEDGSQLVSAPNDFSIKLPTTPLLSAAGLSTSRPASPSYSRVKSSENAPSGYFPKLEE
ncbi:putative UDP-galactose transporter [Talaromyces proteolyticus]|uniref:UDP-galactose transporter n=1 Tax=Talaromyces proteolyticus TaxID=1131652 RepID=A0AAD4KWE7_9EURO|nr:putative UDP-galactose transporter [Talaromyces proteolyticus]KAH8701664.1 putative UDP-galactose transporter [Talaromyces proteolyticus]